MTTTDEFTPSWTQPADWPFPPQPELGPTDCGTNAAYQVHRKRGEKCAICRRAATAHVQSWRIRTGRTHHLAISIKTLAAIADVHPGLRALLVSEVGESAMDAVIEQASK